MNGKKSETIVAVVPLEDRWIVCIDAKSEEPAAWAYRADFRVITKHMDPNGSWFLHWTVVSCDDDQPDGMFVSDVDHEGYVAIVRATNQDEAIQNSRHIWEPEWRRLCGGPVAP